MTEDKPKLGFSAFQDEVKTTQDPKAFKRPGTSTPKPQWGTPDVFGTFKPNKYKGKCDRCQREVLEGEGIAIPPQKAGNHSGRFSVRHLGPVCPAHTQPQARQEPTQPPQQAQETGQVHATVAVPDGKYTIVFEEGTHVTLRVRTQYPDSSFKPGVQLIAYLYGRDNTSDFTQFGEFLGTGAVKIWRKHADDTRLSEAVKVLVEDPKAASSAYGLESKECGLCGRELTNPESILTGIGPVCSKKAGWA